MSADHLYKVATDATSSADLRDFLQQSQSERNLSRPSSQEVAKKMPMAGRNVFATGLEEGPAGTKVLKVINFGDWACPCGHFKTSLSWTCDQCEREDRWRSMDSDHRYKVATDATSIAELHD